MAFRNSRQTSLGKEQVRAKAAEIRRAEELARKNAILRGSRPSQAAAVPLRGGGAST